MQQINEEHQTHRTAFVVTKGGLDLVVGDQSPVFEIMSEAEGLNVFLQPWRGAAAVHESLCCIWYLSRSTYTSVS